MMTPADTFFWLAYIALWAALSTTPIDPTRHRD